MQRFDGLDIAGFFAEKQFKVPQEMDSSYRSWRTRWNGSATLAEPSPFPERLLQAVWARQRIQRDALVTTDGGSVQVLHPGFWNREAGPDFRDAVIRTEHGGVLQGDVEVDLITRGWRDHGHGVNARFRNVILHVVWEDRGTASPGCPTVVLKNRLDAPLEELQELLAGDLPPPLPVEQQGRCSAPLGELEPERLRALLEQAAQLRLESRASQFRARARQAGWEQSLVEGLFRALGYKHNSWIMQHLGGQVPRLRERVARNADALHWQAVLLGVSGLLPDEMPRKQAGSGSHLRRVWDVWWRERDPFAPFIMPRKLWHLHGIRPANHPHRRLALAAHWLADAQLFKRLEDWFARYIVDGREAGGNGLRELFRLMNPAGDEFWSHHWTLRSKPMNSPQPLLGATRLTDIVINILLPWFFTRAREGRNDKWRDAALAAWLSWPKAEDNVMLKQARARLLGNARPGVLRTAAQQQGMLQILRDFCDHSNALCEHCRFPDLVRSWRRNSGEEDR